MKHKADILNKTIPGNRRKPYEFIDATLIHALYWLLLQCGAADEYCRTKYMELYINISPSITGSAEKTTRFFVETYGIDPLNKVILKGLESNVKDISVNYITSLLKALDCYLWLIEKKLLLVEELFPTMQEHRIFLCIHSFVHKFWQFKDGTAGTTTMIKTKKFDLQTLQCKTLIAVFNFLQELLNINVSCFDLSSSNVNWFMD